MDTTLIFSITEYVDHTYRIACSHIHYRDLDGLHEDNILAKDLGDAMNRIADAANNKYHVGAIFEIF